MDNINIKIGKDSVGVRMNDPALVRRWEKATRLNLEKIKARIEDFLSRN